VVRIRTRENEEGEAKKRSGVVEKELHGSWRFLGIDEEEEERKVGAELRLSLRY